jgi:hypothetical protein
VEKVWGEREYEKKGGFQRVEVKQVKNRLNEVRQDGNGREDRPSNRQLQLLTYLLRKARDFFSATCSVFSYSSDHWF